MDLEIVARPFTLERQVDVTGISGTGVVAVGCELGAGDDTRIALRWLGSNSMVYWESMEDLEATHCYPIDGKPNAVVVWQ